MAHPSKNDPAQLIVVTVTIDGERAELRIEPRRTVGELIKYAISALDVDEDAKICHLAGYGSYYSPHQRIEDAGIEDGTVLALRLPL
jgi:hypothetical protein